MIVRSVIVPAAMLLLGDANWLLPGWLDGSCRDRTSRAGSVRRPAGPHPA